MRLFFENLREPLFAIVFIVIALMVVEFIDTIS